MNNMTSIKIPKKYHEAIENVYSEYENGYFIELKDGFISEDTRCGIIHEWTQKDLLQGLKWVVKEGELDYKDINKRFESTLMTHSEGVNAIATLSKAVTYQKHNNDVIFEKKCNDLIVKIALRFLK